MTTLDDDNGDGTVVVAISGDGSRVHFRTAVASCRSWPRWPPVTSTATGTSS